jgi:hypothetical protein
MTDLYKNVEQYVFDSFIKAKRVHEVLHLLRTLYWLEQLRPNANEALRIASISHDIERAFRQKDVKEIVKKIGGLTSREYFEKHEIRGAEIIGGHLEKQGARKKLIERVKMLVSRHERGGNDDQNLLKDADSIGFFEIYVTGKLMQEMVEHIGKDEAKKKIDFMYNRISADKVRKIVKKWYDKAIADLGSFR